MPGEGEHTHHSFPESRNPWLRLQLVSGELLKVSLFMLEWGTQLPPVGAGKPAIISIYALGNNAGQFEDVNRHGSNYHSNVGCD